MDGYMEGVHYTLHLKQMVDFLLSQALNIRTTTCSPQVLPLSVNLDFLYLAGRECPRMTN